MNIQTQADREAKKVVFTLRPKGVQASTKVEETVRQKAQKEQCLVPGRSLMMGGAWSKRGRINTGKLEDES